MCAPESWTNFDVSPRLRLQKIPFIGRLLIPAGKRFPANVQFGDIAAGLPISAHSCRAVYSSQVLECLALEDCRKAIKNTFDYLESGGIFRFNALDAEHVARSYLNANGAQSSIK